MTATTPDAVGRDRARAERGFDQRSPLLAVTQLVLLLGGVCLAMAMLAGLVLAGVVVQLGSFGH